MIFWMKSKKFYNFGREDRLIRRNYFPSLMEEDAKASSSSQDKEKSREATEHDYNKTVHRHI